MKFIYLLVAILNGYWATKYFHEKRWGWFIFAFLAAGWFFYEFARLAK
jgi:hypothetical protein